MRNHAIWVRASAWRADDVRPSDIEDLFVCTVCGKRGADVRPDWTAAKQVFGQK